MEEENLTFSVLGLTIRGFYIHDQEWVPEPGQRLPCNCSGQIDIMKDGKSVGTVAAEAPNEFKNWLKNGGQMKAVVTGYPQKHKKKGLEVPCIFVLTSAKNNLMTNIKRAIEQEISKKKKKSLKLEDGDITQSMEFPSGCADQNELNFSIEGMTVRGFHVYMKDWVPEKGDRCLCSISDRGSVELSKDRRTIGNIPEEEQGLFRAFIKADGEITAVVSGDPTRHKRKGKEVPVTYIFKGEWTNKLKNRRNQIKGDIEKRGKKKKSLKFIPGDVTLIKEDVDNNSDGVAGLSGEDGTKIKLRILKEQVQNPVVDDGSGEKALEKAPYNQVKGSNKRPSDGSEGTVPKKVAASEQV